MGIEAENVSTIIAGEEIKFGKSIPVDSVQEIVRKDPENIPEIYLREMQGSVVPHLSLEIPVIDLSLLSEADEGELSRLDIACREWGFFQMDPSRVLKIILIFKIIFKSYVASS
ncbi:uncharacterized protein A4U43_C04F26540 [Asparagus officinalis]|uniref:Non-haem dioxygenase N-terminal domain-containing protein n=1 Tax=Asparagus officinalis TaxID=4686 RepID=A0A5P1F4D8_ASPOF|nr:uncharacterized protein A4U43_C04F26540 [Asparagus officinalis]